MNLITKHFFSISKFILRNSNFKQVPSSLCSKVNSDICMHNCDTIKTPFRLK